MLVRVGHCEGDLEHHCYSLVVADVFFPCTYFNQRVESWFPSFVEVIFRFEHNSVHTTLGEEFIARQKVHTSPICICHSTDAGFRQCSDSN